VPNVHSAGGQVTRTERVRESTCLRFVAASIPTFFPSLSPLPFPPHPDSTGLGCYVKWRSHCGCNACVTVTAVACMRENATLYPPVHRCTVHLSSTMLDCKPCSRSMKEVNKYQVPVVFRILQLEL